MWSQDIFFFKFRVWGGGGGGLGPPCIPLSLYQIFYLEYLKESSYIIVQFFIECVFLLDLVKTDELYQEERGQPR